MKNDDIILYEKITKTILSILFILCLFDMPYGFYQIVRFVGMAGFGVLAYISHKKEEKISLIIYISLAILFQPFIKIVLGRVIWNVVDVVLALLLIGSLFINKKK